MAGVAAAYRMVFVRRVVSLACFASPGILDAIFVTLRPLISSANKTVEGCGPTMTIKGIIMQLLK